MKKQDEDLAREVERLRQEVAAMKAKGREILQPKPVDHFTIKISEKGGVAVYGIGRFPVTLYEDQWLRLLDRADEVRAFIQANTDHLRKKSESVVAVPRKPPAQDIRDVAVAEKSEKIAARMDLPLPPIEAPVVSTPAPVKATPPTRPASELTDSQGAVFDGDQPVLPRTALDDWTLIPLTDKQAADLQRFWHKDRQPEVALNMKAGNYVEQYLEMVPKHPKNRSVSRMCYSEWDTVYRRKDGKPITDNDVQALGSWFRGQGNSAKKISEYEVLNHGCCDSSD